MEEIKATEKKEIDGRTYITTKYPPKKRGIPLLTKLAKGLGPSISSLMESGLESEVDWEKALGPLLNQLDPNKSVEFIEEILSCTQVEESDGKRRAIIFDHDFLGSYAHLIRVVIDVLRFQYGDFLSDLGALGQMLSGTQSKIQAG